MGSWWGGAHVFDVTERVINRDDGDAFLLARSAADEAADAAEAGDTHFHHGLLCTSRRAERGSNRSIRGCLGRSEDSFIICFVIRGQGWASKGCGSQEHGSPKRRIKGSTAFVVGVVTLTPIHGAPPRWGIHSYPSPLDGRLEANKSKRGLERSQGPSPSPRLLGPKTATWPVRAHDLAIMRIFLQNVKDICPHISVPHSWPEHQASPPATRSKLATCHLVGSRERAKSTFPTGSNSGLVGGSIPLKMGSFGRDWPRI